MTYGKKKKFLEELEKWKYVNFIMNSSISLDYFLVFNFSDNQFLIIIDVLLL